MKANDPLRPIPGCYKCGASTRSMFYEMMKDDVKEHQCKPKRRISLGDILFPILVWLSIFSLIVSFVLLWIYIRAFI